MSAWVYRTVSPTTGEMGPELRTHSAADVEAAVGAAAAGQRDWARLTVPDRKQPLVRAAAVLRERKDVLAALMADEMGKPIAQGLAEVEKCAWVCEHAAAHAAVWLSPSILSSDAARSIVRFDPMGVILTIMPWNFPLWQVFRFAAPALMAGNAFLLKHAPSTPGCGEAVTSILTEAGVPAALVQNLRLGPDQIEPLIADRRVAGLTLTGSTRAGRAVAALAGRYLKPSVLELGGSDPFIVLDDARIDEAAEIGARSRLLNSGQSCIAAKRFIVMRSVAPAFVATLREAMSASVVGDPRDPLTTIGPMARRDLRDELHRQVVRSIAGGARLALGGVVPDGPGAFYGPTLLLEAAPGMACWDEELFGPVGAVRVVDTEDEAIDAANDSPFGLGASLWTSDEQRAESLVGRLEVGAVFVNGMVKSDPRLPFGGIKDSGWGKELGPLGMRQFTVARTVWTR